MRYNFTTTNLQMQNASCDSDLLLETQPPLITVIPFEAFSVTLNLSFKTFLIFQTWDIYFDYFGFNASQRMKSGPVDLAWV